MWQPVLMISGYFISVLGLAMLFPAGIDLYYKQSDWSPFITASIISIFIGMSLFLGNRTKIEKISIRQGYLLTVIIWVSICLLAALPFMLSGTTQNWADAVFEAVSGITSTAATVLVDVDNSDHAVLLWRSLLNGLGGVGIVIFAVALLPFLGIGGMQIFQRENSDFNDKLMPKISYIAKRIIIIYIVLVTLSTIGLFWAGMNKFDAVNHALSAVSTGGFSTKNNSIEYYDNLWIEIILILSMISGSIPLTYYLVLLQRNFTRSFRSEQVRFFLKTLAFYILLMAFWLTWSGKYGFWQSLRYSAFNVVSITTSTGFASTDYGQWGLFAQTMFIIFALTGGCTGSTSGSIKIFRWQVIIAFLKKTLVNLTEPNRIIFVKIGNLNVDYSIISSVFVFVSAFSFSTILLTMLVAVTGVDFTTAFSGIVGCITNSGPGVGKIVGPAGNFSSFSDFAKYVCAFAMLLGRLEVLTILVVFTKNFWHK